MSLKLASSYSDHRNKKAHFSNQSLYIYALFSLIFSDCRMLLSHILVVAVGRQKCIKFLLKVRDSASQTHGCFHLPVLEYLAIKLRYYQVDFSVPRSFCSVQLQDNID